MAPNPNNRWRSTTRSHRRTSGPEPQYQWPSEERILTEAWSSKAGQETRRPHLSTLDALVAAAQLAEAMLVSAMGLSPAERRWVWLQRVGIRAGAKAVEELDEVDVTGEVVESRAYDNPLFSSSRLLRNRFTVGSLRVELDIVAPAAETRTICQSYLSVDDLLGCKSERYYGEGFKADLVTIGNGWLTDETTIHVPVSRTSDRDYLDIGSSYTLSPTFVNCILGQAQVSQMMLYALDHMDRSVSDNLWMRHVELFSQGPHLYHEAEFDAEARISRTRLLPMNSQTWRVTDFTGHFGPISARYNLAHALPTSRGSQNG
ncbi:AvrD family protein [Microbacterium sp.]|uniref:AvrD family protein n=1 Tax=Microbacterium sp. TaxID=51671 RepID=UPI003C772AB5